jgi:hypothetical protein
VGPPLSSPRDGLATEDGIFSTESDALPAMSPILTINHDRRVADVETVYDPTHGIFNSMFATAATLAYSKDEGSGYPSLKPPPGNPLLVKDIFTDLKRQGLGSNFYERNWDGTLQTTFLTRPL